MVRTPWAPATCPATSGARPRSYAVTPWRVADVIGRLGIGRTRRVDLHQLPARRRTTFPRPVARSDGQELLVSVPALTHPGDLAGGDLQRGEQRGGAVPTQSWVRCSAWAGWIGGVFEVLFNAWIWDFSSTHNTIAFSGGARYSPKMSMTLATSSGSVENLKVSAFRCVHRAFGSGRSFAGLRCCPVASGRVRLRAPCDPRPRDDLGTERASAAEEACAGSL